MKTTTKKTVASKVHADVTAADVTANQSVETSTAAATKEVSSVPAVTPVTKASPLGVRVTHAVSLIQEAADLLALEAPALTAAQRKGMAKLRKGGDKWIPRIAEIAQTWQVQIRTQPTAAMTSAMQLSTALQPLIGVLVGFLQETQDVGFQAESDSWSTATALYAVLKRMSRKDPKLKAQLAPMAEFFAYRHPAVMAAAAGKEAKLGKEARKKEKIISQAETIVAEQSTAATDGAAHTTAATGAPVTPATQA